MMNMSSLGVVIKKICYLSSVSIGYLMLHVVSEHWLGSVDTLIMIK
jgi:hypothetical protein